jgi:predicted aldo/keto reductase-like oxidoreductase
MKLERRSFLKLSAAAALAPLLNPPATAEIRNGMPYRVLGKTGEKVSLLGVGGYHIGVDELTDEQSIAIMRTAVDEGVNFFDNAWEYNKGRSEERMGKALKDGYRDRVFLMTKHKGRDAKTAQEQLETSLRRFQVEMIDLWQFHEVVYPAEPGKIYSEGAIEFAVKAREQGKIRYIGFTGHHLPDVHLDMIRRGFDWQTVQMPINVCDYHFRSFLKNVVPVAQEKSMGIIAMKTMGGENIVKTGAVTPEECLRFAMSQPVSVVLSGMDNMDRLKSNLAVAKNFKPFEPEELAKVLEKSKQIAAAGEFEPFKTKWHKV